MLKPSECGLKVNRISFTRNNGVKIEAFSPDIASIKAHPRIARGGLKVQENVKLNPKLIVRGVPVEMSPCEIKDELIAQNLDGDASSEVKAVYIFPPRENKRTTSCILEVSFVVRNALVKEGRIFLRYAACSFSDYVRVMQCYRCLA